MGAIFLEINHSLSKEEKTMFSKARLITIGMTLAALALAKKFGGSTVNRYL